MKNRNNSSFKYSRRPFDEYLDTKILRNKVFMINHDFDTLKSLSKYCEYFSPKNKEFERPGENIPKVYLKLILIFFKTNINMEKINP